MTETTCTETIYQIDITCDGPIPEVCDIDKEKGKQSIQFKNSTGEQVTITFEKPGFFVPSKGFITIEKDMKKKLTITSKKGTQSYTYAGCGDLMDPRGGRIIVN